MVTALKKVRTLTVVEAPEAPRHELSWKFADPDLVDRIFDYLVQIHPELAGRQSEVKQAVREEFAGQQVYILRHSRSDLARDVLRLFNGRNASEVARSLRISRATVYRLLKQSAAPRPA